jgi:predicted O-methyltransferase YrrM
MDERYFNFHDFYRLMATRLGKSSYPTAIEIGVFDGASVAFLANELKNLSSHFIIYAVDLWETAPSFGYDELPMTIQVWDDFQTRLEKDGLKPYVSPIKMPSVQAAMQFEDNTFDLVFIDANHTYPAVVNDLKAWIPKVKPGGIIAGHDYGEPCGVKQAVDERFTNPNVMGTVWYVEV